MSIAVQCDSCGNRFKAKDEHAGRQAKCPTCGAAIKIVAAAEAASTAQASSQGASGAEPYDSVVDLAALAAMERQTPAHMAVYEPPEAPAKQETAQSDVPQGLLGSRLEAEAPKPRREIPVGLIVKVVILLVIAGGGFYAFKFFTSATAGSTAFDAFEQGKMADAAREFKTLVSTSSSPHADRYEQWGRRVQNEMKYNNGSVLGTAKAASSPGVRLEANDRKADMAGVVVPFTLTNHSDTPITMTTEDFYARGASDIERTVDNSVSTNLGAGSIAPGETFNGVVVLRKMPIEPAKAAGTLGGSYFFIIFNNGEHYGKAVLKF